MSSIVQAAGLLRTLAMIAATTGVLAACGPRAAPEVVRGPDGEPAHVIQCDDGGDCYERASAICNGGGYVIRDSHGVNAYPASNLPAGTQVEMLVSCKADLPQAEATASNERDPRVCQAASKYLVDFGAYWAKQWGASLLDEHPPASDFVAACQIMPQNVQRCMHEKYRRVHVQACQALLVRLDSATRTRIDALFLQVPTGPQGPPPGTTL